MSLMIGRKLKHLSRFTTIVIAVILDAGLIQWIEYYTASESYRETCPQASCFTFWQSFYFLIATVSDFIRSVGLQIERCAVTSI